LFQTLFQRDLSFDQLAANFSSFVETFAVFQNRFLFVSTRTSNHVSFSTDAEIETVADFSDIDFAFHAFFDYDFIFSTVILRL